MAAEGEWDIKSILVASKDKQLSSVMDTLASHHFDKDGLLKWAEESLQFSRFGVVVAAEAMRLNDFSFEAWTGVQGAGKGTNLQAICEASIEFSSPGHKDIPPSLKNLQNKYSKDMGQIATGTGGIFFRPKPNSVYSQFFSNIGDVSKPYTEAGALVPDLVVSTLVNQMIRRRILEGKSGVQIDLYPRDRTQHIHMQGLMSELEKVGIHTSLTIVDLRLLPQETVHDIANNPQKYSEAAVKIGGALNLFHNNEKQTTGIDPTAQFEKINKFLFAWEHTLSKGSPAWWLIQETKNSIKRMRGRGRDDDQDPLALIKRLGSYYSSTMPGLVEIGGVKFISAEQKPEDVISDLIKSLIDKGDVENLIVKEFIKIAQGKAENIVKNTGK